MSSISEYIQSISPIVTELELLYSKNDSITIFDIGACEGEDSIRYANIFPNSAIFCFEPLPENFKKIKSNIKLYKKNNIHPYCVALSNENGQKEFHVSSGRPENVDPDDECDYGNKSSSLLSPDLVTCYHEWLKFKKLITVKTQRFVDFCEQNHIEVIDFVHMDVQGAELMVLEGAEKFIGSIKALWMEVESVSLYKNQPLKNDIEKFMLESGFVRAVDTVDSLAGDQLYLNSKYFSKNWITWNFKPKRLLRKIAKAIC